LPVQILFFCTTFVENQLCNSVTISQINPIHKTFITEISEPNQQVLPQSLYVQHLIRHNYDTLSKFSYSVYVHPLGSAANLEFMNNEFRK
jgi:hypothetical protein